MTIEEAIRIGKEELVGKYLNQDYAQAVQLGIEALERMQDARENPQGCTHWYRLPSEGEANES